MSCLTLIPFLFTCVSATADSVPPHRATNISGALVEVDICVHDSTPSGVMAIDEKIPVQNVAYEKLRARLLKNGQILEQSGQIAIPARNP